MRSRILSSKKVRYYIVFNFLIWIVLLGAMIFAVFESENKGFVLFNIAYYSFFFYKIFWLRTAKLKNIEYDDHFLYLVEQGQEIQLPYTEVRDIELKSLTGVHVIQLYRDFGFGKEIYFKSSLWYPFNFKRIDQEVYNLRRKIEFSKYMPEEEEHDLALASSGV